MSAVITALPADSWVFISAAVAFAVALVLYIPSEQRKKDFS